MTDYTFQSHRGDKVEVKAPDEETARTEAMTKIWGPPRGDNIGVNGYKGRGLSLIEIKD